MNGGAGQQGRMDAHVMSELDCLRLEHQRVMREIEEAAQDVIKSQQETLAVFREIRKALGR